MIVKIKQRHDRMDKLIHYLYGPGRANQHENQHAVAATVGTDVAIGEMISTDEVVQLVEQMRANRVLHEYEGNDVWHMSLSIPKADGVLSDEVWAKISRDAMEYMGFDGDGVSPCPWVAVRHGLSAEGNDHVHLAVSLVRDDGRIASDLQSKKKMSAFARQVEQEYGLTGVDGRTAGAIPHNSQADIEQAKREGAPETQRDALQRKVRAAKALAGNEAEFVQHLRGCGVVPAPWVSPESGLVEGYSVSLVPEPGMQPKWFGGSGLAKDLSLPKLRAQWEPVADPVGVWKSQKYEAGPELGVSADEWKRAAKVVEGATVELGKAGGSDSGTVGAVADSASEVLAVLSERVEPVPGPIAANVKTLAGTAQLRPSGGSVEWLSGVAMVASQATLKGSKQNAMGWLLLLARMQELARALERLHQERNELSRSADLYRQRQQVGLKATTTMTLSKGYQPGVSVELRGRSSSPRGTIEKVHGADVVVRWSGVEKSTTLDVKDLALAKHELPRSAPSVEGRDRGFDR